MTEIEIYMRAKSLFKEFEIGVIDIVCFKTDLIALAAHLKFDDNPIANDVAISFSSKTSSIQYLMRKIHNYFTYFHQQVLVVCYDSLKFLHNSPVNTYIMDQENITLIDNVFEFINNIPVDIIDQTWPKDKFGYLNQHFTQKYLNTCRYENGATASAVLRFVNELSGPNRTAFCTKVYEIITIQKNRK